MPVFPGLIFPPSVFPPSVFPGSSSITTTPGDRAAILAIAELLRETGAFDAVEVADSKDEPGFSRDMYATATVIPSQGARVQFDGTPGRFLRIVQYELLLRAEGSDPEDCHSRASQLVAHAISALQGVEYGGFCLFDFSTLPINETYIDDTEGEGQFEVVGQYAYVVDSLAGMDKRRL